MSLLLVDERLPCRASFQALGEVEHYRGGDLESCARALAEAEVLVVRSVTPVNSEVLGAAPRLRVVASATAGLDHIDIDECAHRGVRVLHAPGHNARAVADWVYWALHRCATARGVKLAGSRLGIVGFGNTGRAVAHRAQAYGMEVWVSDPPLEQAGLQGKPLAQVLCADFVSLHVPLLESGDTRWPTRGLVSTAQLSESKAVVLNAARGEVVDCHAFGDLGASRFALDVFAGEPGVAPAVVRGALLATPHVAGDTFAAKARAAWLLARQIATLLRASPPDREALERPRWEGAPLSLIAPRTSRDCERVVGEILERLTGLSELSRRFVGALQGGVDPLTTAAAFRQVRATARRHELADCSVFFEGADAHQAEITKRLRVHGVELSEEPLGALCVRLITA